MYLNRFLYAVIGLTFLSSSYAEPPFEVVRTCIDLQPKNNSLKFTSFVQTVISEFNENNCKEQCSEKYNEHVYGTVICNDNFYLIINDKKIKADTAINMSVNPEISPGLPLTNRATWYKVDQDNESYLCIEDALTESGAGAAERQYYIVENAFEENAVPVIYYYFFNKDLIPITSAHI